MQRVLCCMQAGDAEGMVEETEEIQLLSAKLAAAEEAHRKVGDLVRVVGGTHAGKYASVTEVTGNWSKVQFKNAVSAWITRPSFLELAVDQEMRYHTMRLSQMEQEDLVHLQHHNMHSPGGEEDEEEPSISLEFEDEVGKIETIQCFHRPLDLSFEQMTPIVVSNVSGHAEEMQVRPGWCLMQINSLPTPEDFDEFLELFQHELSKLPAYSMEMTFQLPGAAGRGGVVSVLAEQRPLGITFKQGKMPVTINKVAGHSKDIGIKKGMVMKSFAGEPVGKDYFMFIERFQKKLTMLPS